MIYDGYLQLRERVIEPLGEARNDYLIFTELAKRLGYGHLWPQTEAEMIEKTRSCIYTLRSLGVEMERIKEMFRRKIEMTGYLKEITGE